MTQEAYENFVARIELEADRHPVLYRVRLSGMAVLGYAYVALILSLLLASLLVLSWMVLRGSGAAIAIKLGILVIPLVWAVLTSMFVRLAPPSGRQIGVGEAPELVQFIEETRLQACAPQADRILITEEFNAAVVQHARLGIFGWPRNYLVLGLPLMQALSRDELRAVIAHEFGHLSGAHGKFGAWIYRLRAGWARLAAALDQRDHWGKFLFVPFFNWYAPAFGAYSFVQARRQEYEADRVAATAAGPATAGAALVRVELQAQFLEGEYWKEVFRQADVKATPDTEPFSGMRHAFTRADPVNARGSLEAALRRKTGFADTHPCLGDRLRAMGANAHVPQPFERSAADELLGAFAQQLATEFDDQWRENVSQWWQGRHRYANESRTALAELEAAASQGELSIEDAFRRAMLTEELRDENSALEQLEALLPRASDHAPTLFALGRLRLERDNESGIELLQRASTLDATATQPAGSLIVQYLRRQGRNEDARPYVDDLIRADEHDALARRERSQVLLSDKLMTHELKTDDLAKLVGQLANDSEVRTAYLVRKAVKHYQEIPMYVLGIQRRSAWWKLESSSAAEKVVARLSDKLECPPDTLIVCFDGNNKSFPAKFRKVPGSTIYSSR
ncbi:MAG: M48 family metalloprotease [Povalibacter sp.]